MRDELARARRNHLDIQAWLDKVEADRVTRVAAALQAGRGVFSREELEPREEVEVASREDRKSSPQSGSDDGL